MSILSKLDFERLERIALRMAENKEIGMANGLTEDQCDALEELCRVRHEIHTTDRFYIYTGEYEDKYITNEFDEYSDIEKKIKKLFGVYPWERREYLDTINWDYVMSDDHKLYYEEMAMEKYPDGTRDGYSMYYDDAIATINKAKEQVNSDIEVFLTKIDQKYKTNYASTGTHRI